MLSLSTNKQVRCLIGKGDIGFLHLLFCLLFLLIFFLQSIYDVGYLWGSRYLKSINQLRVRRLLLWRVACSVPLIGTVLCPGSCVIGFPEQSRVSKGFFTRPFPAKERLLDEPKERMRGRLCCVIIKQSVPFLPCLGFQFWLVSRKCYFAV